MENLVGRYMQGSRKDALSSLRTDALAPGASNDVTFQEILSVCPSILEMRDQEIADGDV